MHIAAVAVVVAEACSIGLVDCAFLAAEELGQDADQRARQAILKAKDSGSAGKVYKHWFCRLTGRDFERLRGDPNIGISLQAAWETYGKPSRRKTPPDPMRFLGFLEGRIGVRPPVRWEMNMVKNMLKNHPKLLKSAEETYSRRYPELFRPGWPPEHSGIPRGASIRIGDIDVKGFPSLSGDRYSIASERWRDENLNPSIWEATVWAVGEKNSGFQGLPHDVGLVATKDKVAVFGWVWGEFYVEGFNLKTGANLFRFSTNYWGYRGDRTGPGR